MKIAYLLPGSGGSFYCGNCTRDKFLTQSLKRAGNDILMIPMYLPLTIDDCEADSPIFYGAVNIYLEQISPIFKFLPQWAKKLLDSDKILRFAAKQSGSTSASGNEAMTISMLRGEHGKQAHDLDILINWLKEHEKPDVVHLSNALLSGLAAKLKKELGCKVICTLQDEDEWVDEMREPFCTETWKIISENAEHIDSFIAVSQYYANLMHTKLTIPTEKIKVVYNSLGDDLIRRNQHSTDFHTIGYMSKINSHFGADILFEAFAEIKKESQFKELKLKYTGGYTDDYKKIISEINRKAKLQNIENDIEFFEDLSNDGKKNFLDSISLFCVPSRRKEAFGMHILEALAAEVPVVMPEIGAYPELIEKSKAGLCYNPEDVSALTTTLRNVLNDRKLYTNLQKNCHTAIKTAFSTIEQTDKMGEIYGK
jgi:glycosyltransferase involved in cell wall biosynthesis